MTTFSYFCRTGSRNTGLLLSVEWTMTLPDGADDAVSLPVMSCVVFMWDFEPGALVDPEYHLRHTVHWRFPQCLAESSSCQSWTYSHRKRCFCRFRFEVAIGCTSCMSPSLSSAATTTASPSATNTTAAETPSLDIFSLSAHNDIRISGMGNRRSGNLTDGGLRCVDNLVH